MNLTSKLVLRLLATDGALLGWTQHEADIKGDGFLRAKTDVSIELDCDGIPREVSIHWADINVETRIPWPIAMVGKAGTVMRVFSAGDPMVQAGLTPQQRLPPVSTKSVSVPIPAGSIGAKGRGFGG